MGLNLRLTIEGSDINDNNIDIKVYLEGFTGTAVTRNGTGDVLNIQWGSSDNKKLPLIYGSAATIKFFAENDYEFIDLFATNSRDVYIEIIENTTDLIWAGFIEPEKWSEPLITAPYEIAFTAYDGLGLLKDEDYLDAARDYYEGEKTPLEILQTILSKTGLSLPLSTRVNIRPSGQVTTADALAQVEKDVATYKDFNCYEVLEALFINVRIFQRGGRWWVLSNDIWQNSSTPVFKYLANGTADGTGTLTTEFTGWWFEGSATLEMMPAIKHFNIKQDYGFKPNLLENGNFTDLDGANFDGWTANGTTPTQRVYDADGNKYVYLQGKELTSNWRDDPRTKFLKSDAIPVKTTTSIPTLSLDFALMGASGSAMVMFGVHLIADGGTHYNLRAHLDSNNEIVHEWETTASLYGIPVDEFVRKYTTGWWPNKTTNYYASGNETTAYPYDEITGHFTNKKISIPDGIPESGNLYIYLFLAHSSAAEIAGSCWRNVNLKFADETEEALPTETELVLINDVNNNYVPADMEIVNGDVPDMPNRLTIYNGSFILASTGAATDLWKLDSNANTYTYAELMARLFAAQSRLPKQSYDAALADVAPTGAMVITDPDNSNKRLVETGIKYNYRHQTIDGKYMEVTAINLVAYTVTEKLNYTEPDGEKASAAVTAPPQSLTNTDELVALIDTASEELDKTPGYLHKDYFGIDTQDDIKAFYPLISKTGFDLDYSAAVTLAFTPATRTFSIQPTGTSLYYFIHDKKYITEGDTVVITDTDGLWFIYYLADTLIASQTAWDLRAENMVPVAIVYWDATNGNLVGDLQPELHSWEMPAATHDYLHHTFGTRFNDGLAVSLQGTTQLNVTGGSIYDEDIKISITDNDTPAAWWQQPLTVLTAKILHRVSSGTWRENSASNTPVLISGTSLQYNQYSGGVWSLVNAASNKYIAYWLVATGMVTYPVIIVPGQEEGDKLTDAREGNALASMQFGDLPTAEHKVIARVLIKSIVAAPYYELIEVNDYRNVADEPTGAFNPSSHASLSGLTNPDHPASAIYTDVVNFLRVLTAADTTVQKALDTLDANIPTSVEVIAEIPTGAIDGANKDYTLVNTPLANTLRVYISGVRIHPDEFTVVAKVVTIITAPYTDEWIIIDYKY